jgi:Domain of unknown function (DUF4145)
MTAWICPFCGHAQTITQPKFAVTRGSLNVRDNALSGQLGYQIRAIGCSNPDCKQVQIDFNLGDCHWVQNEYIFENSLLSKRITPESIAKPQPTCIPKPLVDDYIEACRIRDLSPKASATLARRCLQGMIRDFCGITKKSLADEINALKDAIETGSAPAGASIDSIDAIDGLRKIGNIGAHMEKDINVIVDVDANEAQALIELIESLFEEWYIARDKRQRRFARVAEVATQKTEAKSGQTDKPNDAAPAS